MRLFEFANAEDQMALWKLINDNVWQAIETQRQQQAREAQAKAAKAKLKPRKGRKGASPKISIPSVGPKPPPPKGQIPIPSGPSMCVQCSVGPWRFSLNVQTTFSVPAFASPPLKLLRSVLWKTLIEN